MLLCMIIYCLYISAMNHIRDRRHEGEELGIFCFYKELVPPIKQYSVIQKWTWISSNCVLQNLGQPLKQV